MKNTINLKQARLLVVGDVMLDRYWFGDVERISPEAPVPVVLVGKAEERLGGAANVALNASSLGSQVSLMGFVGQDEAGQTVKKLLDQGQIKSHLVETAGFSTTLKLRVIARQQQMVRVDFEGSPSAEHLTMKLDLFEKALGAHNAVVFSDYDKGSLAAVSSMIALTNKANIKALVDPKGEDFDKYKNAYLLTPNLKEFRQVVGSWRSEEELIKKAQTLRERLNLTALLLTRSDQGMTLFTQEGHSHVQADAREVFDVSGAGDTVIATMACAIGAGYTLEAAMRLANKAGGIVVGKLGTATVFAHELED